MSEGDDRPGEGGSADDPAAVAAAWEDIVAHYGERPALEPGERPTEPPGPEGPPQDQDPYANAWWAQEEHFVPPTPPPAPLPAGARGLAWLGLLGSPVAMVVLALLRVAIPTWLGLLLFVGFVGGLVYLIAHMRRHDDDDPFSGDDGAVV